MKIYGHALIFAITACVIFVGCSRKDPNAGSDGLLHVRFQTDWFPQGEHGGFYYALAKGYYKDEGLDVEILPGGLTYMGALKVTEGKADMGMNKAEAIIRHADQGMPLKIVMATLQHDPQGILLHDESAVRDFKDLDCKKLMAMPGGVWLAFLEKKYGIRPVLIPSDKGMERFLSEPDLAQQCMVTSEPFYAAEKGVKTRVLLLKDSGFDPYHVVYTSDSFAKAHQGAVRAFVRASIRGWRDYLTSDPSPAFDLIMKLNPRQTREQLEYSRNALIGGGYAFGEGGADNYGTIDASRMETIAKYMLNLGLIWDMPKPELWEYAPVKQER